MSWRRVLVAAAMLAGCVLVAGCDSDTISDAAGKPDDTQEVALFPVELDDETWGYIDRSGTLLFELTPQCTWANFFVEGLALVRVDSDEGLRYGFVDKAGAWVIEPQFPYAAPFAEGLAEASKGNYEHGFIDKTGAWIIEPEFVGFGRFSEGLAPAAKESFQSWGVIDTSGAWVIEPQFDSVGDFSEGLAPAIEDINAYWGFIDSTGAWVIPPRFGWASSFSEGLAPAFGAGEDRFGYIDATGAWVIEPQFAGPAVAGFSEGLAPVSLEEDGEYGYIDNTGRFAIPPQFPWAQYFLNGLAYVELDEDTKAYIDRTGKVVWSSD